jgi:hypothetical protein
MTASLVLSILISLNRAILRFLRYKLPKDVPEKIVVLFEVATGAMRYGYFFTAIYTWGLEQVFRMAEAAITAGCVPLESGLDSGFSSIKLPCYEPQNTLHHHNCVNRCVAHSLSAYDLLILASIHEENDSSGTDHYKP